MSPRKGQPVGPDNPGFIGARMRNGYRYIYLPEHPDALTVKWAGYIPEHRVVAELALGRRLSKAEQVHHVNGIRDDNRPENLVVLTASAHAILHKHGKRPGAQTRRKLSEAIRRSWVKRRQHS